MNNGVNQEQLTKNNKEPLWAARNELAASSEPSYINLGIFFSTNSITNITPICQT